MGVVIFRRLAGMDIRAGDPAIDAFWEIVHKYGDMAAEAAMHDRKKHGWKGVRYEIAPDGTTGGPTGMLWGRWASGTAHIDNKRR